MMMRKRIAVLLVSICILFTEGIIFASEGGNPLPPEVIVLNLPNSHTNWKEISRYVTEKEGLVEYIPLDQQKANWSELICFQYLDKSSMKPKVRDSIVDILELLQENKLNSYPGNKVTWRIIEKNKADAIYEWILHKPYKNIAPEHEIARAFLTDTGLNRIGFSRKNREMSSDEREQCIKLLKDSVSLVSIKEGHRSVQGLSMVDRLKDSLHLGEAFGRWKVLTTYGFENGYTMVIHVPPSFNGGYVAECLEVTTMPNIYEASTMDRLFEIEKESIQKKSTQKIKFRLLKQADKEVIYSFAYPQDNLQVTGVARSFLSAQGYYSISYKRGLASELKPEEVQIWKAKLEAIKIRN